MPFPLQTFETTLDAALIEKGKKWFDQGMVRNVTNEKGCVWDADLIGPTKQFRTYVEIVGKEVNSFFCNCGPNLCSHVVALLFELVKKDYPTEKYYPPKPEPKKVAKPERSPVEKLLHNIRYEELKKFVDAYAKEDKDFHDSFVAHFRGLAIHTNVGKYRGVINDTFGFSDKVQGAAEVLREAQLNLHLCKYEAAYAACKAVFIELGQDESAGEVIAEALDLMHEIVLIEEGISDELEEDMFEFMFDQFQKDERRDHRASEAWPDIFIFTASDSGQLFKVIRLIDKMLESKPSKAVEQYLKGHKKLIIEYADKIFN